MSLPMQAPGIENFSPNNGGKEEEIEREKQRNTHFSKNMCISVFRALICIAVYGGTYKSAEPFILACTSRR